MNLNVYLGEQIMKVAYSLPSDMTEDVKRLTIIGGVYKASHYSIVSSMIDVWGQELGIDVNTYYSLLEPDKAAVKIIKL